MMEFALGILVGISILPWYYIGLLGLLIVADIIMVENEAFWATGIGLAVVGGFVAWLGADVNPFLWVWHNVGNLLQFFLFYFIAGALWSIVKWYFFLLKIRERLAEEFEARNKQGSRRSRPTDSYAKYHRGRIMGWIGYWPFSVLGTLCGDVLTRIVKTIYNLLASLYDRLGESIFKDFE